jgi:hypothetical protein
LDRQLGEIGNIIDIADDAAGSSISNAVRITDIVKTSGPGLRTLLCINDQ